MYWDYSAKNIPRARALRKDMTPQERKLWYCFLRTYPIKFYRQRTIGDYIVDFYCPEVKLAVELDGGQHYGENGPVAYDLRRTEALGHLGICMLRFPNPDVDWRFEGVCQMIEQAVKRARTPQSPPDGGDSSPP